MKLHAATYELMAGIIRRLPDEHRQAVADHFANELNQRYPSFDPGAWEDRCGGRLGRVDFATREEEARRARVAAYMKDRAKEETARHGQKIASA